MRGGRKNLQVKPETSALYFAVDAFANVGDCEDPEGDDIEPLD